MTQKFIAVLLAGLAAAFVTSNVSADLVWTVDDRLRESESDSENWFPSNDPSRWSQMSDPLELENLSPKTENQSADYDSPFESNHRSIAAYLEEHQHSIKLADEVAVIGASKPMVFSANEDVPDSLNGMGVQILFSAIPEPSSFAMCSIVAVALLRRRRSRFFD
ncbi:MAG: hypothetical protein AAFN77_00135 [Planctomycetota bacterium]